MDEGPPQRPETAPRDRGDADRSPRPQNGTALAHASAHARFSCMWYLEPFGENSTVHSGHGIELLINPKVIWIGRPIEKPERFGRRDIKSVGLEARCVSRVHCRFRELLRAVVEDARTAQLLFVRVISRHGLRVYPGARNAPAEWVGPAEERRLSPGDVLSFGATARSSESLRFRLGFLPIVYSAEYGFFTGDEVRASWKRQLDEWRWKPVLVAGQLGAHVPSDESFWVYFTDHLPEQRDRRAPFAMKQHQDGKELYHLREVSARRAYLADQRFLFWFRKRLQRSSPAQRPPLVHAACCDLGAEADDTSSGQTCSSSRRTTHSRGQVETGTMSPALDPQPPGCVWRDGPRLVPELTTYPIVKASCQAPLSSILMGTIDVGGKLSDKGKSLETFKTMSDAYPLPEIQATAPAELAPRGTTMLTHTSVEQQIQMIRIPGTPRSSQRRPGQRNAVPGSEARDARSRVLPFDAEWDPASRPHDSRVDHQNVWSDSSSERFRQVRAPEVGDDSCSERSGQRRRRCHLDHAFRNHMSHSTLIQGSNQAQGPAVGPTETPTECPLSIDAEHIGLAPMPGHHPFAGASANQSVPRDEHTIVATWPLHDSAEQVPALRDPSRSPIARTSRTEWLSLRRMPIIRMKATAFTIVRERVPAWQKSCPYLHERARCDNGSRSVEYSGASFSNAVWHTMQRRSHAGFQRADATAVVTRVVHWRSANRTSTTLDTRLR